MNKIKKLSRFIANQIAAGEVVERPASIVKELVENALDAGAKHISIAIAGGGKELVCLRDDGCGIGKADLPLAVDSHATSKICDFNDLGRISSLGFRGEALASIASVAEMTIKSCVEGATSAWQLHQSGESELEITPISHPVGTTVLVKNLFFNTPARRKFLRTDKTEFSHTEELVKRLALSHFEVAFELSHNDKECLVLPPAKSQFQCERRVTKIFGKSFMQHAKYLEVERGGLKLWGWVASPSFWRSQNDLQFAYVNHRVVKDRLLSHAIREAYQDQLYQGRQPAYLLHLDCDPAIVDVNVHPTKHEVRFHDSRSIHDFIASSVKHALFSEPELPLRQEEIQRSLNSEAKNNLVSALSSTEQSIGEKSPAFTNSQADQSANIFETKPTGLACRETFNPKPSRSENVTVKLPQSHLAFHSNINPSEKLSVPDKTTLGVYQERYLLCAENEAFFVVDSFALERLLLKKRLAETSCEEVLKTKPLLFPETVRLPAKELNQLMEQGGVFKKQGLAIERLSEDTLVLRKVPVILVHFKMALFAEIVLRHLKKQSVLEPEVALELMIRACDFSQLKITAMRLGSLMETYRNLTLVEQRQVSRRHLLSDILPHD